ncbi:transcription factor SPT20 homolog-like 1 [Diaphorina citri]|uniref:Transcription factor SPT20 homolog-like 1 n=1 Tax=Diaphorina citri TaxID=121845 RepID=A0A3Q0J363_DIACI|nr:transcription factor SPT20 homolog-like 1 [Diaphorina citri]
MKSIILSVFITFITAKESQSRPIVPELAAAAIAFGLGRRMALAQGGMQPQLMVQPGGSGSYTFSSGPLVSPQPGLPGGFQPRTGFEGSIPNGYAQSAGPMYGNPQQMTAPNQLTNGLQFQNYPGQNLPTQGTPGMYAGTSIQYMPLGAALAKRLPLVRLAIRARAMQPQYMLPQAAPMQLPYAQMPQQQMPVQLQQQMPVQPQQQMPVQPQQQMPVQPPQQTPIPPQQEPIQPPKRESLSKVDLYRLYLNCNNWKQYVSARGSKCGGAITSKLVSLWIPYRTRLMTDIYFI